MGPKQTNEKKANTQYNYNVYIWKKKGYFWVSD